MRIRQATPDDAERCFEIETAAYASDAAARRETIALRIDTYPKGFLLAEVDGKVAGFINSGCAHRMEMANAAFKDLVGHDPEAPNVVILSVAVDPGFQGRGLSRALMGAFVADMRARGKAEIYLICRDHHVGMYERFGFRYDRPSASRHGGMDWHEMSMPLLR